MQFSGGGHALISSVLATPFSGRFAVYGSKGWAEVRDKSHPENAEGWTLTTSMRGTAPYIADYPADGSVLANLEAFAGAIEGRLPYPVGLDEMIHTVSAVESMARSTVSGIVERVIT
jgi:predicted dehydrogenase